VNFGVVTFAQPAFLKSKSKRCRQLPTRTEAVVTTLVSVFLLLICG
jgi:hypothetical protein